MGTSSSKHEQDNRNLLHPRSMSFSSYNVKVDEGFNPSKISWNPERSGNDVIDVNVSMRQNHRNSHQSHQQNRKHGRMEHSASFSAHRETGARKRVSIWEKRVEVHDRSLVSLDSKAISFRSMESADEFHGLQCLLSPDASPSGRKLLFTDGALARVSYNDCVDQMDYSRSLEYASNRISEGSSIRATSSCDLFSSSQGDAFVGVSNKDDPMDFSRPFPHTGIPKPSPPERSSTADVFTGVSCTDEDQMEGPGSHIQACGLPELENKALYDEADTFADSEEPNSPLFDPSILETFEKAIEASTEDGWGSNYSSQILGTSDNAFHDSEKINDSVIRQDEPSTASEKNGSRCAPRHNKENYIDRFEMKSPPGCKDRIVLYFTSLRGVRKTYENCSSIRVILKGYGVQVDERDVWMHSKFKDDLVSMFGPVVSVPQLFIKGRHIGGAEDVKYLHEEGILGNLLEGLPADCSNMCSICGDVRFIPCTNCGGSCKLISEDVVSRCPDCNENGLLLCPFCSCS